MRLINHSQLQKEIEKIGTGYEINDSFSFLKDGGLGAHTMMQVFSKKATN